LEGDVTTRTRTGGRKALASIAAAGMLLALVPGSARAAAFALQITDKDESSWTAPAMAQTFAAVGPITSVQLLMHRGTTGTDVGTFRVEIRTAPGNSPSGYQAASSGIVLASKTVSTSGMSTSGASPSTVPVVFDSPAIVPTGVTKLALVVLRGVNTGLRWHASMPAGVDQYPEGEGFLCVTGACWTGYTPQGDVDFNAFISGSGPLDGTSPRVSIVAPRGPTKATSLTWLVLFDKPVAGLSAGDFTKTGGADRCSIGVPSSSNGGVAWSMTVSGCTPGTLRLALKANAVHSIGETAQVPGPAVATKSAATLLIDRTKPRGKTPTAVPWVGAPLNASNIPVKLSWSAATDGGGSGVMKYEVGRSTNGGDSWSTLGSGQPTYAAINQPAGGSILYRVRPVDWAGNKGTWVKSATLRPRIVQQTSPNAKFSSGWTTLNDAAFSGGSAKQSDVSGASARYTFKGRAIGIVMTTDPAQGVIRVYIDGDLRKTVDMADFDSGDKVIVYARRFSSYGEHVIRIVSSSGARPNVVLDAFVRL
jgi:hypothetical protein